MGVLRRTTSVVVAFVLGFVGSQVASHAPALADGPATQIVSSNPANFTPNVLDGEVDAIVQVGSRVIIGGTFTQIANSTGNGAAVYNRTNIAAFNATTGVVDTAFNPTLDGSVAAIIPAADGNSVYVTGGFNQVNGTNTRKITRLNVTNGQKVAGFNAGGVNGQIKDVRLVGNTLYVAGLFTTIKGQARSRMASLDAASGAVTNHLALAFEGTQNGGVTNVYKFEVTPAGDRLLAIGNFRTVNGLDRRQVVMLDLSGPTVTVAPWQTDFFTSTCANAFASYLRDLDISEDGTFAVLSTTGAYRANTSCDTISRFEVYTDQAGLNPTWITYTGGDTTYAVEIARGVAYAGGHMRWVNNPFAGDNVGAGAVPREGIVALDVVSGLPFSWNPGRERGVGVFDFHVTSAGLWAASDTDRWANELRQRLAFFPWNGGSTVPADDAGNLPSDVYLLGNVNSTSPGDASVLYRVNAGGPVLPSGDDGPGWAADTSSTSTLRNGGSNVSSYTGSAQFIDPSVPATDFDRAPLRLFETERYDPASGSEMQWNFPVAAGTPIQVRLYFANRCNCSNEAGERVFSVQLDGSTVLSNLDLSGSVGHSTGIMRSFDVVSDGTVNIQFLHVVENPLVSAIEIVRTDIPGGGVIGVQDDVARRFYNGVTVPAPTTVAAGTEAFGYARGSFTVNQTVYTGWMNGSMSRRTFDGTSWGAPQPVALYGNTFIDDLNTLTGLFYDPVDERIYYTMSGNSSLFWRYFTPESHVVGAARFTATGAVSSLDPSRVRGMFLSGGQIHFADSSTGNLLRIGFAGGVVTGSAAVADTTVDWRSRGMFVWTGAPAPAPNTPPASAFTNSCSSATCDFDGSGSTDIDGTIVSYSWSFGDGQNGTGAATTRTYATSGTYDVTLTVTDDDGDTGVVTHQVNVVVPPNQPPTASFTTSCLDLSCTFDGSAGYDPDGTITAYSWDFGDGQAGTGVSPAHAYATGATYSVTLTVTDNRGATATSSAPVPVTAPPVGFREAASFNGNAVSPAVTLPGNVAAGDGLVLIVTANKDTTTTTPTGWTLLGTESDGTPDMRSWAFARSASAGLGGTTVSVTLGTQSKVSMVLLAYSGANPGVVSATASAAEPANTASHATPPVSVVADGSFVVSYWADKTPGNAGWTLPAEVTERLQSLGSGTGQITAVVADSGSMGVGAWSGVTATSSVGSGKAISWSIVIAPV